MEQQEDRRERRTPRGKVSAACAVTAAMLGGAAFAWIHYASLAPVLAEAQQPTPSPAYGNVMAVTRDPSLPTPLPSLRRGSRGERVVQLQNRLTELGYYSGVVDGQYGPATEQAVMLFQRANGLEADGYVGEATQARLDADDAVPYTPEGAEIGEAPAEAEASGDAAPEVAEALPAATPLPSESGATAPPFPGLMRNGSSGEGVTALQNRLQALGYLSGAVDGRFGPGTKSAVQAFQQVSGLTADGIVGEATWAALFAPGAQVKPTPIPLPELGENVSRPYVRADGLPLVVNKQITLPDGYQTLQLVDMNTYCDPAVVTIKYSGTQAEREAVDALMTMLSAAQAEGIGNWQISAAYRTVAYQQQLMDEKVEELMRTNGLSREKAQQAARNTVADPGASEHHLGTCFDITVPNTTFRGTRQHKWLEEHCWEYGFILRYTEEKQSITGYLAEAWHYRWVGQPHAGIMRDENLCLEEYVSKYGAN